MVASVTASPQVDEEYIIFRDVPIIDTHAAPNRPAPFNRMDEDLLRRIVEVNNRRMADTGDEIPIVSYHTVDDAPDGEQPPIIGYAKNLYVAPFGRVNPRACIYVAEWKIRREFADIARSKPRRSIELWPDSLEIDPIALCGADTPERHLGQIHFDRNKQGKPIRLDCDHLTRFNKEEDTKMPFDIDEVLAALNETPLFKKLMALVDQGNGMQETGQMPGPAMEGGPETQPVGFGHYNEGEQPAERPVMGMPPYPEGQPHMPPKREGFNHMETPGPGGTHEPGRMPYPKPKESAHMGYARGEEHPQDGRPQNGEQGNKNNENRTLRENFNDEQMKYRRLEEQMASEMGIRQKIEGEMNLIQRELRREKRERECQHLQNIGLQFNRAKVLDRVQDMTDDEFKEEVEFMKENFKKAPIEVRFPQMTPIRDGGESTSGSEALTLEESRVAVRYCRELTDKGHSQDSAWKEAMERVKKEGV